MNKELLGKVLAVLSFVALFAYVFKGLWNYGMLAYGDATPFPNDFRQAFQFFASSFDPRSPGITMPQASVILSTLVPLEAAVAFLFGGNFIWAQRLFHFLPIPLSFITIYFFVSKFTTSRIARFATAVIYSGNHFMVAEFAGGFEGNLYIPAFFPLLVYFLYRIFRKSEQNLTYLKEFLGYSGLLAFAYVLSDHVLILLAPFWLAFVLAPLFYRQPAALKRAAKNIFILFVSFVVIFSLSAYHAYNYIKIAFPFLSGSILSSELIPFFVKNVGDTYWKMSLTNITRLGGAYFMDFFSGSNLWARLGFTLPLAAFSWFFFPENRKGTKFKIGLVFTLGSLVIILFIYLTALGLTVPLFTLVPALFRFRNPSRLSLFLAFLYSPLIALTLNSYVGRVQSYINQKLKVVSLGLLVLGGLFTVAITVYLNGFFSGDLTMRKNRGSTFYLTERHYELARYLAAAQSSGGPFRVAHFPWNHESAEMKLFWLDPYSLGVPIEYGAYIRNEYLDYIKSVYQAVSSDQAPFLAELLAQGGVKYVVLDSRSKDFGRALYSFAYHVPWLDGSYDDLSRIVSGSPGLKLTADVAGYKIYENTKFNKNSLDFKKAGFYMENRPLEDKIRLALIFYTGASWAIFVFLFLRGENSRRSPQPSKNL